MTHSKLWGAVERHTFADGAPLRKDTPRHVPPSSGRDAALKRGMKRRGTNS